MSLPNINNAYPKLLNKLSAFFNRGLKLSMLLTIMTPTCTSYILIYDMIESILKLAFDIRTTMYQIGIHRKAVIRYNWVGDVQLEYANERKRTKTMDKILIIYLYRTPNSGTGKSCNGLLFPFKISKD